MSIEHLILCSTGDDGIHVPALICDAYMRHYRSDSEDVQALGAGAGLSFILGTADKEKAFELAEHFIDRGLDVNGVDHFSDLTPLHVAALENHPATATFLLARGADKKRRGGAHAETPLEFARVLQQKRPEVDRRELIELLSY